MLICPFIPIQIQLSFHLHTYVGLRAKLAHVIVSTFRGYRAHFCTMRSTTYITKISECEVAPSDCVASQSACIIFKRLKSGPFGETPSALMHGAVRKDVRCVRVYADKIDKNEKYRGIKMIKDIRINTHKISYKLWWTFLIVEFSHFCCFLKVLRV